MAKSKAVVKHTSIESAFKIVERFKHLYETLNSSNCHDGLIEVVYRDDLQFQDSFHLIDGIDAFRDYCASLYENLTSCEFNFHEQWVTENDAMLVWTMRYKHPRINRGKEVSVEGSSLIRFEDKVYFHRDYFDGGELLYEHIPLVGTLIRTLKNRMN